VKALLLPLFVLSSFGKPVTEVSGTVGESVPLASDCLVAVGTTSHCGGGNDR
jgi:hypothetical protein